MRDWLETLGGNEYVSVARTKAGLSASVTANGRLALGQFRPFSSSTPGPAPLPTTKPPLSPTGPSGTSSLASTKLPDAQPTAPRQAIRLFYSYSHKDEELRKELEDHLSLLRKQGVFRLQGLPIDFRSVTTWTNRDEAFTNIAKGIRNAIEGMRNGTR